MACYLIYYNIICQQSIIFNTIKTNSMKFFRIIMPLFLMICFVANINAQNLEQYIPKDATIVTSFNLNNLNKKVSLDKIQSYDFYQEGMKEMLKEMKRNTSPTMVDAFENPSKYGMDVMSETFMFGEISEDGSYFGLVFNLNDQAKFTEFFTKNILPEAGGEMGEMNGFQTMTTPNAAIAWNKNVGVITGGTLNWNIDGAQGFDEKTNEDASKKEAAAVMGYLQRILKKNPATSLLSNVRFAKAATKKSDMKMWIDYKWMMQMQMKEANQNMEMMGMPGFWEQMAPMYEDTYYAMDLNFNDGKMMLDSEMFANKKLLDMWRKVGDRKLNKNFFKYLPKENMGYMTMAINMENMANEMTGMFAPMIEQSGMTVPEMEGMALDFLATAGIKMDRKGMYNLLKGDMVIAVTGMREFNVTKTQYDEDFNRVEVDSKQKLPEFLAMMSIGSESDIMQFVKMGIDAGMLGKESGKFNAYKLAVPTSELPMDVFMAVHDGMLFFTNNNELVTKKLKKGFKRKQRISKKDQLKLMTSGSMFYWDIPQSLNAAAAVAQEQGMMDGMSNKMLNVSKESLESLVFRSDKAMTDAARTEFSLNFVNKKMNSLDQMFSYFNEMFLTAMGGSSM